ncbi:hypothetical protein AJ78_07672 [Emergomyces pasteurianus Ep9510]|uniref:MSP domain-containing protein n=1 Tax=Emergomyces pasteurianus Ep9510 TaxID=1447872 RepID=A0A1J9P6R8_9EURO|nr:hypothetical protein AJ78_07672 [Emergomyces pasteurianus Ep9510]
MSVNLITEDDRNKSKDPSYLQDPTAKSPQKFLRFQRPFTREVSQTLTIQNNNDEPVAFKVKTTAPKSYCVRPNSGRIGAGESVDVQVLLQAMKDDKSVGASKDKFLVQSVAVSTDKDFSNVSSIWQHVEQTSKGSIHEQKIKVEFLPPKDIAEPATTGEANGIAAPEEDPPAYTSPAAAKFDTPSAVRAAPPDVMSPEVQKRESTPSPPALQSKLDKDTTSDELKSQLAEAKAQIEKLRDQLADQGLRQRNISSTAPGSKSSELQQQRAPQSAELGVPLRVVAGLCFLSFLLAYIFF